MIWKLGEHPKITCSLRGGVIMINIFIMYGISSLLIILGFIALLTQKIYIDRETNQPTEIEIPFLGKLKTNVPAIVFVFLGFGLAFITFDKSFPPKQVDWNIKGSFENLENMDIDWTNGKVALIPTNMSGGVSDKGTFTITVKIDDGKTLEEVFEFIDFSHDNASTQINLRKEYENYTNSLETLIQDATKTTRIFKPKSITYYGGTP